jgi:hypothetical protein
MSVEGVWRLYRWCFKGCRRWTLPHGTHWCEGNCGSMMNWWWCHEGSAWSNTHKCEQPEHDDHCVLGGLIRCSSWVSSVMLFVLMSACVAKQVWTSTDGLCRDELSCAEFFGWHVYQVSDVFSTLASIIALVKLISCMFRHIWRMSCLHANTNLKVSDGMCWGCTLIDEGKYYWKHTRFNCVEMKNWCS